MAKSGKTNFDHYPSYSASCWELISLGIDLSSTVQSCHDCGRCASISCMAVLHCVNALLCVGACSEPSRCMPSLITQTQDVIEGPWDP